MTEQAEIEFRRRWYEAHCDRFAADPERVANDLEYQRGFRESATEALELRDSLARTGDVEAFRAGLQEWAVKPGTLAFNGFSGQMLVNQLVKRSEDTSVLAGVLPTSLSVPADDDDAAKKIQALVDYIEEIRVGAHPAPGHSNFLLSYFWGLEEHDRWPVMWSSAVAFLEFVVGAPLPATPSERYRQYLELVRHLDDDHERFERVASWWDTERPVFLDPVLVDRCRFGRDPNAVTPEALKDNARALVSVAKHLASQLADEVASATGRGLKPATPSLTWKEDRPRSDLWADWRVEQQVGLRLWVGEQGATVAVRPGAFREGWVHDAAAIVDEFDLPGFEQLRSRDGRYGRDVGFIGFKGEFVYGPWYEPEELGEVDVEQEVVRVGALAQPLLDRLISAATGEEPPDENDPLIPWVERFRASRGYPSPADEEHKADRERFASLLAPDNVALADPAELRQIWNTKRYGSPGPQSGLNTAVRDADAAEYDRIIDSIRYLCWGEGDDSERIDALLNDDQLRVKGFGESGMLKLLAICHPDRYLPVFPYSGTKGKRAMLNVFELPEPQSESRGQLQVQSNDMLRERLDRFFPGDPWGMAAFCYWYSRQEQEPGEETGGTDPLDQVAESLLVDKAFLDDIVALLEDKAQVILYGPPGTGKTYLARKLAEALVPDPTRRALVQFHPSTSYEDFFEGYRPETSDGQMVYRLTPGPLAQLAERALDDPGQRHIMIIDEINRANLPKVLGELLFLFEYRDEQVRTLYRPEDAFELPRDLWFIGTMNTADRSIALVDAALRRRFHFVPFFPNHGPMEGLLDRWLADKGEPAWVGELVAMVNDELAEALGGPHLQLGASHFMKKDLGQDTLRRIWQYNIEPFIEDQFFGDPAQIEHFRFDTVLERYLGSTEVASVEQLESIRRGDTTATGVAADTGEES